ncbi:NB-ARC domain-containing protein [Trichocoleus sp. DQ-A3]
MKRHLKDVEVAILRGAWQGQNYEEIAEVYGYSAKYLKQDIGPKLWQLLSEALGEKVSKTNFQAALERRHAQLEAVPQPQAPIASEKEPEVEETTFKKPDEVTFEDVQAHPHQDWGEAPDVSIFYGRTDELATLTQWTVQDRCRLVTLLGMGGIGKTAVAVKLASQIQNQFEYLIWRSLRHAPPLLATLAELNAFLTNEPETEIPATVEGQISRLLNSLRDRRCLLILDDWEMVLRGGDIAGYYREGYEGYGQLIKRVGEERHQSCLLLLSREKPVEIASLAGEALPVRALQIKGLKTADAKKLLATKGFSGSENGLDELVQIYRGHPVALKIIATTIQELFNSNIVEFIGQSSLVIGDIFSNLLNQHFERFSDLGKSIMYWLAIERKPVSLSQLKANLCVSVSTSELLAVLESLGRRSLIEKELSSTGSTQLFTLQPVVMKYVTNEFIEQICQDIIEGLKATPVEKLGLLRSHALVKDQEPDDIKAIQERLIIKRIQERLRNTLLDASGMEVQLRNFLSKLREYPPEAIGYAQDNLLKLLREN